MTPLIIFAILQLADIWTTHHIIKNGGRELNPIMAKLFNQFGVLSTLIVIKAVVVGAITYANYVSPEFWQIIIGLIGLYGVVVYNNFKALRVLREKVAG